MSISAIKDLFARKVAVDSEVTVQGWVRTRRDSKAGISFLNVYDGSCFDPIQAIIPNTISNYEADVLKLTAGCSVVVTGTLVESPGKGQAFEIQANHIEVIGFVDDPDTYPISPKHHTLEYLRDYAHLRPRTNTIGAVARLRHTVMQAIHRFFNEEGYFWVNTPIITSNDCEGAGELFRVSTLDLLNIPKNDKGCVDFSQDFFGNETFLTVSGQLNVESYCCALSNVYTFGPTFRAENSNTARHVAEFWMVEPEIAFGNLNDTVVLAEKLLKYVIKAVLEERSDDMAFFEKRVNKECISRIEQVLNSEFVYMDYTEAVKRLEASNKTFDYDVRWGIDLQTEHERYLCEELVGGPVALLNYPETIKPFYMRTNDDQKTVAAMDVLVPGVGELIGGSQREERLDVLDQRITKLGLNHDDYIWYRDLRRYGTVPHAGFGLGFERLLIYLSGIANIRDAIPFPRTPGNAPF